MPQVGHPQKRPADGSRARSDSSAVRAFGAQRRKWLRQRDSVVGYADRNGVKRRCVNTPYALVSFDHRKMKSWGETSKKYAEWERKRVYWEAFFGLFSVCWSILCILYRRNRRKFGILFSKKYTQNHVVWRAVYWRCKRQFFSMPEYILLQFGILLGSRQADSGGA